MEKKIAAKYIPTQNRNEGAPPGEEVSFLKFIGISLVFKSYANSSCGEEDYIDRVKRLLPL